MPKLEFTTAELKQYFSPSNRREHYYAGRSRDQEVDMRVHADGIYPTKLIDERRPNEPAAVQTYRKSIFVPKTKPYFNKIESTLQKIRRSSDWAIRYPDESFDKVVDGEKMNDYAEHNYPIFGSVTNWAFSLLLRNYLIDANCVVIVAPIEIPDQENEYLKPRTIIFNSCDVIDFAEGDYCVLRNRTGCLYYNSEGRASAGESYYIITTQAIYRYDQLNGYRAFGIKFEYNHGLDDLPAFKVGGIVIDVYGSHSLYESRISGILPEFNEALREYSDLQAAKVLHLYPERWEYTNNQCKGCKGFGILPSIKDGVPCEITCTTCEGTGYVGASPYSKIMIAPNAENMGQTSQIPTPPAGFVEKDVEIIKVQEQGVQDHIYNALASINFEFLAATPLNQSGTAKEVDKDELNNTVHAVAEDLVRIIDKVYFLTALYRYSTQYTADEIYSMLPMIAVPEKYDILNSSFYDEQLKTAITNSYDPSIVNALQVSYATKAFNNDPKVAEFVALVLKLDPLAGIDEDTKMSRLSNNGITQLDYIVSSNINKFVHDAVDTVKGFLELDTVKQKAIIYTMAESQSAEQTAVIADIPPDQPTDPLLNG